MDKSIDVAKEDVCSRVKKAYPDMYNPLNGIGYYVQEFTTLKFCAAWNKAYCICEKDPRDGQEHVRFTLAGVPSKKINAFADSLMKQGWSFGQVCDTLLGYNVTYAHDITGLNARAFPEWGSIYVKNVADYRGITSKVVEPHALCLYPMAKTVNDTSNAENACNMQYALHNRPSINIEPLMVTCGRLINVREMIYDG